MKKILLTGTTTTGKTTLLNAFSRKNAELQKLAHPHKKIILIPEVAEEVLRQRPGLEKDPQFQDILFEQQVHREIAAETQHPDFIICDRGVLDILAHSALFGHEIKQEWKDWTAHAYDQVLILDKNDIDYEVTELQRQIGERDWSAFRDALDDSILQAVHESKLPWQKISGTVEERLKKLERILEQPNLSLEGQPRSNKERR